MALVRAPAPAPTPCIVVSLFSSGRGQDVFTLGSIVRKVNTKIVVFP